MRVKKKKNKDRVSFSAFPFGNPHLLYQSDSRRNMNDLIFSGLAPTAAPVSSSAQVSRSIYLTRPSRRTSITCARRVPYRSGGASVVLLVVLSGGARIVFLRSSRFRGGIGERVLERKKKGRSGHKFSGSYLIPRAGGVLAHSTVWQNDPNDRKKTSALYYSCTSRKLSLTSKVPSVAPPGGNQHRRSQAHPRSRRRGCFVVLPSLEAPLAIHRRPAHRHRSKCHRRRTRHRTACARECARRLRHW